MKNIGLILDNKKIVDKVWKITFNKNIQKIIDNFNQDICNKEFGIFNVYVDSDIIDSQKFNKNYFLTNFNKKENTKDSDVLNFQMNEKK